MYLATALPEARSVQLGDGRNGLDADHLPLFQSYYAKVPFDLRSRASMIRHAPRGFCSEGLSASLRWEISTSGNSNKTDS